MKAAEDGNPPDNLRPQLEAKLRTIIANRHGDSVADGATADPHFVGKMYHYLMEQYAKGQVEKGFRLRFREHWQTYGGVSIVGAVVGCVLAAAIAHAVKRSND